MEKLTIYLRKLRFDPKLENSWIAKYLNNPRLLILIIFLIVLIGIASYINLPRNLNPQIRIPIVLVSTALPGANPEDVESLVTIPIENALSGTENIKQVTSSSLDSFSTVVIEFESGTDPEKAKTDVQSTIDSITDLPQDAQTPRVQKLDFERQPVWTFALTGQDLASLMRFSQSLKEKLENLEGIDNVEVSGFEQQEIQILLKPDAISTYKINPQILSQTIKLALSSLPAGSVRSQNSIFSLTIDPAVINIDNVRKTILVLNNQQVQLQDIATVSLKSKPEQLSSYFLSSEGDIPTRSVRFDIFRTKTVSIEQAVHRAEEEVKKSLSEYGSSFTAHTLVNLAKEVSDEFNELIRDLTITVSLVFIVLLLFLGIRQALVAAATIPFTFLVTFTVMNLTDISLNFLAFFSLLLSLGLLVDDAIVVASAMTAYYRSGKFTPLETALLVWRDFIIPILTTTITTVWAFVPLLLSTGIIGEFIRGIPIIVSTTLLASFFIAMFVTLPLIILLLKGNLPNRIKMLLRILLFLTPITIVAFLLPKNNAVFILQLCVFIIGLLILFQVRKHVFSKLTPIAKHKVLRAYLSKGVINFSLIEIKYRNLLERILRTKTNRRKAVFVVIAFSLFAFSLFPLGFVKNEFFPRTDVDFLFMNLELPPGTYKDRTSQEALNILKSLKDTPHLEFATVDIGSSFESQVAGGTSRGGTNNAQFTIILEDPNKRDLESAELAQMLRKKFSNYQTGSLTVIEQSGGPPAGADLQIKLLGDNLGILDAEANKIEEYLAKVPGTTNINKSIKPGTSKIVFVPDDAKLALSNIDRAQLGFWLRTFASGFEIDSLTLALEGDESRDITIRLDDKSQFVNDIGKLNIPTPQSLIPLNSLGYFKLEPNPTVITREDGKRTISVTASVEKGFNVADINRKLENYATTSLDLPEGYSWKTGGINEENQRSVNSILLAMLLSTFLIITTMVIQFSSFRRALIVILVIPLSISGVFIMFALTQTPLSFPALIGILALFGIVVKNSILIVDKIMANRAFGMHLTEAIADASQSRLEAITLTTLCTIAGLIPITLSDPLWRGLGGAIIAGLTFSGIIMLFFIPVVYFMWYQYEERRG